MSDWNERLRQAHEERAQQDRALSLYAQRQQELTQQAVQRARNRLERDREAKRFTERIAREIHLEEVLRKYQNDVWRGRGVLSRAQDPHIQFELTYLFDIVIRETKMMGPFGGSDGAGTAYTAEREALGLSFTSVLLSPPCNYDDSESAGTIIISDGDYVILPRREPKKTFRDIFRSKPTEIIRLRNGLLRGESASALGGERQATKFRDLIRMRMQGVTYESFSQTMLEIGVKRIKEGRLPK